MNYSHFFRGGLSGVLKCCNVQADKRNIFVSTIDFRPTLTYESTSADWGQQLLTSFYAKGNHCGVFSGKSSNAQDKYLFPVSGAFLGNLLSPNVVCGAPS